MKIVEYAIKIKDLATPALTNFGRRIATENSAVSNYGTKVRQLTKFYSLSYTELQHKIRETENVIRNSVLKSEIRQARQELARLQAQAARHKGNVGTVDGVGGGSKGMGLMGGIAKVGIAVGAIVGVTSAISNYGKRATEAYNTQELAEQRLGVIMRQRMGATEEQINAVKQLATEQQRLGVIGDEVQLAGGQQLGTFLNDTSSLKTLLPAMNDLLAQQKGLNATEQDAVGIGNLMGKVMQGQTSALTRVGVTFSEAEEKVLKSGNEQQRAAMLAQVVKNNVGEMNAALARTDPGKLKQDANDDGDRLERFGALVTKMQVALLPLADIGDSVMEGLLPIVESIIPLLTSGVQWIVDAINTAKPYLVEMIAPAVVFWNQLKGSASGLMDYVEIIGQVWTESIYPAVKSCGEGVMHVLGGLIEWISKSHVVKGVFAGIIGIVGGMFKMIKWLIGGIVWLWDNVVKPILDKIEEFGRWLGIGAEIKFTATDANGKKTEKSVIAGNEELREAIQKNTAIQTQQVAGANRRASEDSSKAITGGGTKFITMNISKFFDNIVIQSHGSVRESEREIEDIVLQCMGRVLANGANSLT